MKMVVNGDKLVRNGQRYEVICADNKVFVIAPDDSGHVDYDTLEPYSNDERILDLASMGFSKVE